MNREIKFRAWDKSWNVMYSNFQFIKSGDDGNDWIVFTADNRPFTTDWKDDPFMRHQLIIMQFIGKYDKGGKEIYEGDILKPPVGALQYVIYREDMARFVTKLNKNSASTDIELNSEVIGNIYQHPELLNQK